jgi:hypothetical protein
MVETAVLEYPMANKPGPKRDPKPVVKSTTKVNRDILRKANMVAQHRGIDLYDYVESLLAPAVERDYHRMIKSEADEAE